MPVTFFLVLLLLSACPSYAEWVETVYSSNSTIHADPTALYRKGDLVKLWELIDFDKAQFTESIGSYISMKVRKEYDCSDEERMRILATAYYSEKMGTGEVVKTEIGIGQWLPIIPKSVGESLWLNACEKR